MKKQKLIESIKKNAARQIESDIKNSIVKELYGTSKKEIKKLKKQILKELKQEMFAEADVPSKIRKKKKNKKDKGSEPGFVHTNTVDAEDIKTADLLVNRSLPNKKKDSVVVENYETGQTIEYKGFKFDVDRMSAIVTGRHPNKKAFVEKVNGKKPEPELEKLDETYSAKADKKKSDLKDALSDKKTNIYDIKSGANKEDIKKMVSKPAPGGFAPLPSFVQGFNIKPGPSASSYPGLSSMNMVPSTSGFVKTDNAKITPAKKEEIAFFIGKLKEGIDNLGKGEKNINYRHKKGEVYTFSFSKQKLGKDDFSFTFDLDLNMYTLGAKINKFDFNIDGFNFDKGFVEILDMIAVLDATGMSLRGYIDEISGINASAEESKAAIKENLKTNAEAIRANAKLGDFIFDQRILRVLKSNDIRTYGQLKKIEDLTALKGVGEKTANKIDEYLN